MSDVLIFSPASVPVKGKLVAGPGIRSWEIAKGLLKYGHNVALAVPDKVLDKTEKLETEIPLTTWKKNNLNSISKGYECVILPQGHPLLSKYYTKYVNKRVPTVVDIYTPNFIECLNVFDSTLSGLKMFASYQDHINPLLKRGDYFICSSEKQKLYYLGVLSALGRLNPLTHDKDLIGVVPFGVPDDKPVHNKNVLKGKLVEKDDFVLLWFGGIYPWYDAVTVIRALKMVTDKIENIKLVFLGVKHPTEKLSLKSYFDTVDEIKKLKVSDNVLFVDWQPYEERANWYFESDLVISTYKHGLETELSYRTRLIDFVWGGLPIITSGGDEVSNLLKENMCGEIVEPGNSEMLAKTIINLATDKTRLDLMRKNAIDLASRLTWSNVLKPLHNFCLNPSLAADRKNAKSRDILDIMTGTYPEHLELTKEKSFKLLWSINIAIQNASNIVSHVSEIKRKEGYTKLFKKIFYKYLRSKD